jgi:hypothetical protein
VTRETSYDLLLTLLHAVSQCERIALAGSSRLTVAEPRKRQNSFQTQRRISKKAYLGQEDKEENNKAAPEAEGF